MKPFDERFADSVRDVFDAYTEPVDLSALEQLRRNLNSGSGGYGIVHLMNWRTLAAASILLISTAALFWTSPWDQSNVSETAITSLTERMPAQEPQPQPQHQSNQQSHQQSHQPDTRTVAPAIADLPKLPEEDVSSESPAADVETGTSHTTTEASRAHFAELQGQFADRVQPLNQDEKSGVNVDIVDILDFGDRPDGLKRIQSTDGLQPLEIPGTIQPEHPAAIQLFGQNDDPSGTVRPLPALTAQGIPVASAADPFEVIPPRDRSTGSSFGITAGHMVTYTSNQVAGGMGFFAGALQEWRLTESMSLSSGGMLAWNRFDVEPGGQAMAEEEFFTTLATRSGGLSSLNVDLNIDPHKQYSWVALDIPLNMKWDVGGNNHGRYNITLGLSSLIYLQQRFSEEGVNYSGNMKLNEEMGSYDVNVQRSRYVIKDDNPAFTRFDFGRLLNVSAGYTLKNSKNPLSFELYLKYPLGTLTSREISMGLGGVSVRYSIGR